MKLQINVEHIDDGMRDYDSESFEKAQDELIQNVKEYIDVGLPLNNGDMLCSESNCYWVIYKQLGKSRTFPDSLCHVTYYVTDKEPTTL